MEGCRGCGQAGAAATMLPASRPPAGIASQWVAVVAANRPGALGSDVSSITCPLLTLPAPTPRPPLPPGHKNYVPNMIQVGEGVWGEGGRGRGRQRTSDTAKRGPGGWAVGQRVGVRQRISLSVSMLHSE